MEIGDDSAQPIQARDTVLKMQEAQCITSSQCMVKKNIYIFILIQTIAASAGT